MEFPYADQTIAGSWLIPELVCDLIQREGHIFIGTDLHFGSDRKQFFMGRTEYIRLVLTVVQGEHGIAEAGSSAGRYIDFFRDQRRHREFLTAGRIHFFPDDGLNVLHDFETHRQHHIHTGRILFDKTGTDQQVAGLRVFIFYIFPKRIKETVFQLHKHTSQIPHNYSMLPHLQTHLSRYNKTNIWKEEGIYGEVLQ